VLSVLERGNPKPFKEMTKPCVVKLDETPTNLYAISQRLLVSCLSIECLALGDQGQGRRGGDFPEKRIEIPERRKLPFLEAFRYVYDAPSALSFGGA
jgi:hypothetical protein